MIDPSITDAVFGRDYLGGKSQKTARRTIERDRIPHYRANGHVLIRLSDAEAWRQARLTTPQPLTLKSMIDEIADKVLRDRNVQASTLTRRGA